MLGAAVTHKRMEICFADLFPKSVQVIRKHGKVISDKSVRALHLKDITIYFCLAYL